MRPKKMRDASLIATHHASILGADTAGAGGEHPRCYQPEACVTSLCF